MSGFSNFLKYTIGLPILILITVLYGSATILVFLFDFIGAGEINHTYLSGYGKDIKNMWKPNYNIQSTRYTGYYVCPKCNHRWKIK